MAVPGSAEILTASTLDARLFCVSITPLLLPVVPEVKIIVAIASASGQEASSAALFPISLSSLILYTPEGTSSTSSWSIHTFWSFGQFARNASRYGLCFGLKKSASESDRFIRSISSSHGSAASSGTAVVHPVIIPR